MAHPHDVTSFPLEYILPIPIFTFFFILHSYMSPRFDSERKRAYISSTFSSAIMSVISLPFAWNYMTYGLEVCYEAGQHGVLGMLGKFGVIFFGTYLFTDLAIGYLKYPSQVGLLTGWIHHICYIIVMIYLLHTRHSPIFLIAGIMEVPTFDLAISNLFPHVRNDLRFLTTFLLIRIVFHTTLLIDCLRPVSMDVTEGSWVPSIILTIAWLLHVSWFHAGVNGYLKRRSKGVNAPTCNKTVIEVGNVVVDTAAQVDPTVLATLSQTPSGGTPDDSPLVTPFTPNTGSTILRDSFFPSLSNFPNLPQFPSLSYIPSFPQLPQLANIPAMPTMPAIPTFSDFTAALNNRDQINFGYKHAVKSRWGEQREKYAAVREGMTMDSMNLDLRRRQVDRDEPDIVDATGEVE